MTKKFYKNEKFQTWFFSILYFLMTIAIVITGCFTFKKVYYLPIVVSGMSMWPTLSGAKCDINIDGDTYTPRNYYGIADIHVSSVNSLHRFDVVATNYPSSWTSDEDYKIKRVWGFPGETLNLTYNDENQTYTFTASKDGKELCNITSEPLKSIDQEYEFYKKDAVDVIIRHSLKFMVHTFNLPHKSFNVSFSTPKHAAESSRRSLVNHKLLDNEYFVMGDNWGYMGSSDCYSHLSPSDEKLTKNHVQGRIICFYAYVNYINNEISIEHDFEKRYDF